MLLLKCDSMENIRLENIELVNFNKENKEHLEYLKKLLNDASIKKRFQGILPALLSKEKFFGKGFLLEYDNELIGYTQIGNFNKEEESVYLLGAAIDKEHRGKKTENGKTLAELMLNDISNYILHNYKQVKQIKLTISDDNVPAIKLSQKCGYEHLTSTHYGKNR